MPGQDEGVNETEAECTQTHQAQGLNLCSKQSLECFLCLNAGVWDVQHGAQLRASGRSVLGKTQRVDPIAGQVGNVIGRCGVVFACSGGPFQEDGLGCGRVHLIVGLHVCNGFFQPGTLYSRGHLLQHGRQFTMPTCARTSPNVESERHIMTVELPVYPDDCFETLTLEQMAAILHKSPKTIKNLVYKSPDKLPARLKLPGRSDFLWRKTTVLAWLEKCEGAQ